MASENHDYVNGGFKIDPVHAEYEHIQVDARYSYIDGLQMSSAYSSNPTYTSLTDCSRADQNDSDDHISRGQAPSHAQCDQSGLAAKTISISRRSIILIVISILTTLVVVASVITYFVIKMGESYSSIFYMETGV